MRSLKPINRNWVFIFMFPSFLMCLDPGVVLTQTSTAVWKALRGSYSTVGWLMGRMSVGVCSSSSEVGGACWDVLW